ncbi:hypothetical protein BSK61_13560 [Paenibacillus odorifer]|nr:hypothetical protein BSK61_13560 [Paenibacillus odorifer]
MDQGLTGQGKSLKKELVLKIHNFTLTYFKLHGNAIPEFKILLTNGEFVFLYMTIITSHQRS